MRVIKAVLFVAVLVCCLTSVFGCNPANSRQSEDGLGCICHSGYQGATCDDAQFASCTSAQLSKTEATNFPSLSIAAGATKFTGNTLFADVEAVYVYARQYEELKFTPLSGNSEAPACALGNSPSYWTQARSSACNDSFTLAMPWAHHTDCGFANNTAMSNAEYMYMTGYLHIKYTDWLGVVETFNLTRSTKVPYSITVKFQKHVTVTLKPLNVTSDVRYGVALTEDMYDPVTQRLTLQLTTIVNWPNMFFSGFSTDGNGAIIEGTHLYMPNQVQLLYQPSKEGTDPSIAAGAICPLDNTNTPQCGSVGAGDSTPLQTYPQTLSGTCTVGDVDSVCKQSWTWIAQLDPAATGLTASGQPKNCSFDDDYNFLVTLYTCRSQSGPSAAPTCTNSQFNISYTIQDSFVCGVLDITPSVHGVLVAFPSTISSGFRAAAPTSAVTHFSLGTAGNFYAQIESDGNDISVVFTNIRFKDQSVGAQWTNLYDTATSVRSQYVTVYDTAKYFNVYFHSSTFKVNPNSQTVYTFSATVTVSFSGNPGYIQSSESKKRTVEMQWEQSTAQATTNVFMRGEAIAPAETTSTQTGVTSVTFIASVVGAVAGTMIIVFVVVGLALRARSTKEDGMSASLMAASAAASEVANRA